MLSGRSFAERDLGVHEIRSALRTLLSALCPLPSALGTHATSSTILPRVWPASLASCAARARSSGQVWEGDGRTLPSSANRPRSSRSGPLGHTRRNFARLPSPRSRAAGSTAPPKKTPRLGRVVTYVPLGRRTRRQAPKVLLATASKTTS